ncbi:MAG TPA: S8 family serine peptidase [Polyangia bacterium]|jgi:subtilisin family serine protease
MSKLTSTSRSVHSPLARLGVAILFAVAGPSLAGCGADNPAGDPSGRATALTSPASFLVSFTSGSIPANVDALIAAAGGTTVARYTSVGALLARSSRSSFAQALRAQAGIDAVGAVTAAVSRIAPAPEAHRPAHPRSPHPGAGDPLSFRQWDMDQIHAPAAHVISNGKKSVIVGVLDSGIDVTHPDLVGQVDATRSASCIGGVPNTQAAIWANDIIGHGTHVSGTIAGLRNGVGIVGVAPGVRLAAVKVAVDDVNDPNFGLVLPDAFVCAIDWSIAHGFDLMNASLNIDPFTAPIDDIFCSDQPDREAIVKIIRRAVLEAGRQKVSLVAATGNFFTDLASLTGTTTGSSCKVLPVQLPRVIGVSTVGFTQKLSFYSNYGFGAVDVTGPGGDSLVPDPLVTDTAAAGQVLSSVPPNSLYYQGAAGYDGQVQDCSSGTCATYAYLQGTSQAAPHVTGVAALIISRFGKLTPEALLVKLSLGATALACPPSPYDPGGTGQPATCTGPAFYNSFYGAGEVDALTAVR